MRSVRKQYGIQVLLALGTAIIVVFLYANFFQQPVLVQQGQVENHPQTSPLSAPSLYMTGMYGGAPLVQDAFVDAAEKSIHAVVHVKISGMEEQYYRNPLYEFFYGEQLKQQRPVQGFGSGVIISPDGYIVTNHHVIAKAENIEVTLHNNKRYKAELIGEDPGTDLAVLKIEGAGFAHIPYGDSDLLRVGEWVLAVGNPFQLTSTVTAGIVSAKGRNLDLLRGRDYAIESFIQTDAALNPGNSGGALVNLKGELVGINAAILSPSGTHAGNSFAIPVSIVQKVVSDIMEYGQVQRAVLGIHIKESGQAVDEGELEMDAPRGVYVAGLRQEGAAEKAGIQVGDVILAINGHEVNSVGRIQEELSRYRPNDEVDVRILRKGKERVVSVALTNVYGSTELVRSDKPLEILGAEFAVASEDLLKKLSLDYGVQVKDAGSGKIASSGIRDNFVIRKVNNRKIYSLSDLETILRVAEGGVYVEGVYPNGVVAYYAFGL